jgi:hypothetical protein
MPFHRGMAALSTQQEYDSIREAIQKLTTLNESGERRDVVSTSVEGFSVSYSSSQLSELQAREILLARRLSMRNLRRRVSPDFSYEA